MSAADDKTYVVVTCRIDGKESSGAVYGISVSVVDEHVLVYNGVFFDNEPIDPSLPPSEMISLTNSARPNERPETFSSFESSLDDYIRTSRIFQNDKSLNDLKSLEHKITYFCTSAMSLNALTFLGVGRIAKNELNQIISPPDAPNDEGGENNGEENLLAGGDEDAEDAPSEVAVMCDPVLDPVNGVSAGDIAVGTTIYCKMREGSTFYNLMEKVSPGFDGTVTGDVTGVKVNELGRATVAVNLSDGMTGAIKVASNVRIKVAEKTEAAGDAPSNQFGVEVIFAVAGVIIFLCIMAVLFHYLS
ncbi:MAG: hypothetical protein FWE55_04065 [Synergistaceae bacterium]|nr:hypothetical protein [Synergistaceae bacterium]